jgi:hypothetical protein
MLEAMGKMEIGLKKDESGSGVAVAVLQPRQLQ